MGVTGGGIEVSAVEVVFTGAFTGMVVGGLDENVTVGLGGYAAGEEAGNEDEARELHCGVQVARELEQVGRGIERSRYIWLWDQCLFGEVRPMM